MLNKIEIQQPKTENLKEIGLLFETTIIDNFKKEDISDPFYIEVNKEIENQIIDLKSFLESNKEINSYLIACYNDRILGTIAYGEPNQLINNQIKTIKNKFIPEIKSVYILPNYQKKGIGSILLKNILLELNKQKIEEFYLDCGYKEAQYFWIKRLGKPNRILNDFWRKENHHMIWYNNVEEILNTLS